MITETAMGGGSATGTIMATTLTGMAGGQTLLDTASGQSAGNQIGVVDGFASNGAFSLVDGAASLTIKGTLGAPSVRLVLPSLIVAGSGAIEAGTGGTVSVAADAYSVAGTVSAPGGLVALGLLHEGAFTVAPGGTIERGSLLRIFAGGGTIALGTTDGVSADGTNGLGGSWGAGTSGSVTSLGVTGALSLTANASVLGLFSRGPVAMDGVLTVGTLVGAAGGDFLAGSVNAITDIGTLGLSAGGLSAGGSVVLTDGNGLVLDAGSAGGTTQLSGAGGGDTDADRPDPDAGSRHRHCQSRGGGFDRCGPAGAERAGGAGGRDERVRDRRGDAAGAGQHHGADRQLRVGRGAAGWRRADPGRFRGSDHPGQRHADRQHAGRRGR